MRINNMTPQHLKGLKGKDTSKRVASEVAKDGFVQSSVEGKPDFMKLKEKVTSSAPGEIKEKRDFSKPLLYTGAGLGAACFLGGLLIPGAQILMPVGALLGGGLIYAARPKVGDKEVQQLSEPSVEPSEPKNILSSEEIKLIANTGFQSVANCVPADGARIGKAFLSQIEEGAPEEMMPLFKGVNKTFSTEVSYYGSSALAKSALKSLGQGKSGVSLLVDTALNGMAGCKAPADGFWIGESFLSEAEKISSPDKKPFFDGIKKAISTEISYYGGSALTESALKSLGQGKSGVSLLVDTALNGMAGCKAPADGFWIGESFLSEAEKISSPDKKPFFDGIKKAISTEISYYGGSALTESALKSLGQGKSGVSLLVDTALNGMAGCKAPADGFWIGESFLSEAEKISSPDKKPFFDGIKKAISTEISYYGGSALTESALKSLKENKSGLSLLKDTVLNGMAGCKAPADQVKIGEAFIDGIEKEVPSNKKPLIGALKVVLSQNLHPASVSKAIRETLLKL